MSRIGVGILGLSANGGWAAKAHLPALRELGEVYNVVGLSGSTPLSARQAASQFDVPFHTADAGELAAHPSVDLLVISVKVPDHANIIESAVRARKPVLCEWPLAIDGSEASQLAGLAQDAGVRTFIGLQSRSNPALTMLRDRVRAGHFGRIHSTTATAILGSPWNGSTDARREYLSYRRNGATMLSIPVGHFIDAMTWTLGDFSDFSSRLTIKQKEVRVRDQDRFIGTDVHDDVRITGTLVSGAPACIHFRGSQDEATKLRWEIKGDAAEAVFEGTEGHFQFGQSTLTIDSGQPTLDRHFDRTRFLSTNTREMYRQIAEDLKNGSQIVPDFAHACRLHQLLEEIETSETARAGMWC